MERNLKAMNLNYDNYKKLIAVIDEKDLAEAVEDIVKSANAYVSSVDQMETMTKMAYVKYEGQELREHIQNYDEMRRRAHEAAIANVKMLNRIANMYRIGNVFVGDVTNRYEVADFCLDLTVAIFKDRTL